MTIYFDMDGTIANLYAVQDWLPKLRAEDETPYSQAAPLVDMIELSRVCQRLQKYGIRIGIVSWLSKEASADYKRKVRQAKKQWLEKYFPLDFDEIHMVKYGYSKRKVAGQAGDILIDDEENNAKQWESKKQDRICIHCKDNQENIISELYKILSEVSS